jgi:hypothetical protein
MASEATAVDRVPTMDKESADWRAWYLGVIEQGEHRDERIEGILRQTLDEYRAGLAPASGVSVGEEGKVRG